MAAEKELEELVKEAVERCKVNKCNGCPFKGSPSCCVSVLEYVTHVTKGAGK